MLVNQNSNFSSNFDNFNIVIALVIFCAYIVVDGLYAYYTLAVTKHRPFVSASTSFLMHFILAFGVLNYVNNFLYIIPLAIGSFIGTYLVVDKERKVYNSKNKEL